MSRKFIATILVASIAITGISAVPARALSGEDTAKVLFGLTALFMIGKAIDDHDDRRQVYTPSTKNQTKPRPLPDRVKRHNRARILPAECLRKHNTWDGRVRMLGRKCLKREYGNLSRLPQHCRVSAQTDRGMRHGYAPRCLRENGYRLSQR
ncbi:hypothetical protein FAP39_15425 [Shimia litoralis]|uniref:Uncharacterized protein n=1 Tax=Shimia litoralis TaxID=420403 RepID=A0A4U7MVH7_9RHOB|nr:hypothetical protein [Shimia litoralis]TKZ17109.1 hypothetical protein FAP39_15425 [Shimia litoralis]